jgi:hypothetical protein
MSDTNKTHYRAAFNSPYLSSADIVEPTVLTVSKVKLEIDKTKKTKDKFNTCFFVEKEIRKGEELKPMILNATNSKTLKNLTGSPFIDDWTNISVTIYVDNNVKFGREIMDGLRISPQPPRVKKYLDPSMTEAWEKAKTSYLNYGNLDAVIKHMNITPEHEAQLIEECNA